MALSGGHHAHILGLVGVCWATWKPGKNNGAQQCKALMYKSERETKDEDGGVKSSQGET
jgi:hypothetical protein